MIWQNVFYNNLSTYISIINQELEKEFPLEPLSNHLKVIGGYAFKSNEYQSSGIPVIRISDFNDEKIDLTNARYYKENKLYDKFQLFSGDIIIAMTGGTIGKLAIVQQGLGKLYLNQRVGKLAVKNKEEFIPEYVYWLARGVQDKVKNLGYGGAQPNVSNAQIEALQFPFPDKNIQLKIVEFLNDLKANLLKSKKYFNKHIEYNILKIQATGVKLFTISDECNKQQSYLQLLRQTVLQEAVQGKLTKQNESDQPAGDLLKRIKAEKQKLVKEGKLKNDKELPSISEDEIPFELPKGWIWCRLKDLGYFMGGGTPSTSKPSYWNGNIPWITPKDMKSDYLNNAQDKITMDGVNNSSAKLIPPNSILIVGRSGILKRTLPVSINTVECVVNQDLKVIVPYLNGISRYIQLMLQGHEQFILNKLVKYGMTVHSLMYQEFEFQLFPLPPFSEQQRIETKVQEIQQQLNDIEKQVQLNLKFTQQLLDTYLREVLEKKSNNNALPDTVQKKIIPIERKILAGHIIHLFNDEKYFGLTKFQKTFCVCEHHAQVEYEMNYEQEVAGPYDREFAWAFREEMQEQDWFQEQTKISMTHFIPGENVGSLIKDYAKHYRNKGDKIRFVLQLFKGKNLHQSELIATLYAAWNNRLIRKEQVKISLLVEDVHNWSEQKIKYTPEEIKECFKWMNEIGLIPTGFGKEIKKPSKILG